MLTQYGALVGPLTEASAGQSPQLQANLKFTGPDFQGQDTLALAAPAAARQAGRKRLALDRLGGGAKIAIILTWDHVRSIALETTQRIGTLAALEDDRVRAALVLPSDRRSAQSLAPGLRDLLAEVGWKARELDLVAVASGPGSFTGLRVGVTTAKTLAYAAGAAIVGVPTLEAIAAGVPDHVEAVEVVLSAERQQLFVARFAHRDGIRFGERGETQLLDIDTWLAGLEAGMCVTGPALGKLTERIPPEVTVLEEALWPPTASNVGRLGVLAYHEGRLDDVWQLVPQYFRKSAAEERREKK